MSALLDLRVGDIFKSGGKRYCVLALRKAFDPNELRDSHGRWARSVEAVSARWEQWARLPAHDLSYMFMYGDDLDQTFDPAKHKLEPMNELERGYSINTKLRKSRPLNKKEQAIVRKVDSAFTPSPEDLTLYRGLAPDAKVKFKEGKVYKDKAFIHTSLNPYSAGMYALLSGRALVFNVVKGTKILRMSKFEQEILLPRNTKYKVTSIKDDVVYVDVIPLK